MSTPAAAAGEQEQFAFLRGIPLFEGVEPRVLQAVAAAMRPVRVRSGETLVRQGDPSDSLYVVVHGRLRVLASTAEGTARTLGETRRGDTIGEMGLITGAPRSASIVAIRDSILLYLSAAQFNQLVAGNPDLLLALARIVVRRASDMISASTAAVEGLVLAVLPAACSDEHLAEVGHRLAGILAATRTVARVDGRDAARRLGREVSEESADDLANWLTELEDRHGVVIFQGDAADTAWTRFCARQADKQLLVADAAASPPAGAPDRAHHANPELLLLHDDRAARPDGTARWQAAWPDAASAWHVRRGRQADWERLARLLTGRAVGLALGGGGARGFAHLGVLRALQELGQPVDVVGGTSFGALVAALVAMEMDWRDIHELFKEQLVKRPPQHDYTLPIVALASGGRITSTMRRIFGDLRIEDLWLPFLCMTTNLSRAVPVVHTSGPVSRWVRASLSLPGLAPPVIEGGEIFVDGCIFNNLPADVMAQRWHAAVVAVEVSEDVPMTTTVPHADVVSGWGVLARKILPFGKRHDLPTFPLMVQRAAMAASAQSLERVRNMAAAYLHPDVGVCNVLDWGRHESLVEAGYRCAMESPALAALVRRQAAPSAA